jgi:hypothetical protein
MPDVVKREREARRKIIRQWMALTRNSQQSIEEISAFAKTAAQQNKNAFVPSRRDPYEKARQEFTDSRHSASNR